MKHSNAWELIPWFVNDSLPDDERSGVAAHLQQCADCSAEVELQRRIMTGMRTLPLVESMPHASFQKLCARIDAAPPVDRPVAMPRARGLRRVQWLTAAVVVQTLLLGLLAFAMLRSPTGDPAADFRTVSSPQGLAAKPSVRAVFSPDMTLGELQALLERAHLRIVDGPSPDGVYTLALASPKDDARQALLTLRAHPAARFAEPIGQ